MTPWNDTDNRFSQTGYSSPTLFPEASNYKDLSLYAIDLARAQQRQESHLEFRWEQEEEQRQEWYEYQAEAKAEREERYV